MRKRKRQCTGGSRAEEKGLPHVACMDYFDNLYFGCCDMDPAPDEKGKQNPYLCDLPVLRVSLEGVE